MDYKSYWERELSERIKLEKQLNSVYLLNRMIDNDTPGNMKNLLSEVLKKSIVALEAGGGSIVLYDEEKRDLYFYVTDGDEPGEFEKNHFTLGDGFIGEVAMTRRHINCPDIENDSRFNKDFNHKDTSRAQSLLSFPIARRRKLFGVITVINKAGGRGSFSGSDLVSLEIIAGQIANLLHMNPPGGEFRSDQSIRTNTAVSSDS